MMRFFLISSTLLLLVSSVSSFLPLIMIKNKTRLSVSRDQYFQPHFTVPQIENSNTPTDRQMRVTEVRNQGGLKKQEETTTTMQSKGEENLQKNINNLRYTMARMHEIAEFEEH
eukprot:CAMPEP_0194133564 /NCGR_PEP_ID=MMETSP0152-20130528/3685_1 /TAXON_ID=1049557 /ORGANISM="Thalassiothrix antarctica, Strain L6-D1" /LENGTH=113 /DNA_ID=CAMNT_0038828893 /DNA_START=43 /DNA_END=384 /DNA_ORIENTATION=+